MEVIERAVVIARPVEEVFAFYKDFRNLPRFLGDVMEVKPTGLTTSRWTIEGPLGVRTHWSMELVEERLNEVIRYQTEATAALVTRWEVFFSVAKGGAGTTVRERLAMPLGRVSELGLLLIGKHPEREVSSNLQRLKELLETGRVETTVDAVRGKFDGATSV